MQVTHGCRRWMTVAALALVSAGYAARAEAAIELVQKDGWSANFDGFLNLFLVDTFGDAPPAGVFDVWSAPTDRNQFRIRTGFLPSALGFNATAPEWEGMKVKLRVGIYVQVNSNATRTTPTATYINSPLVDWREFNITVSGKFGELLVGRALNLYQADAVLSDVSLFGVGVPGQLNVPGANVNGWPTLGHIGFGYLYPAFGAQVRYTTPELGGFKLAVEIGDPSQIVGGYGTLAANVTTVPDLEATLSWATKSDGSSVKLWLGGLVNKATFANENPAAGPTGSVTGKGGAAGVKVGLSGLEVVASGFWAEGLGTYQQLDGIDSMDGTGALVTSKGYLLQAAYKAGETKLGANFGQVLADRTADQKASGAAVIEKRQSFTLGVYHDLNTWLKLVAEYSRYQLDWFGGASQAGNVVSLGGFFFF